MNQNAKTITHSENDLSNGLIFLSDSMDVSSFFVPISEMLISSSFSPCLGFYIVSIDGYDWKNISIFEKYF